MPAILADIAASLLGLMLLVCPLDIGLSAAATAALAGGLPFGALPGLAAGPLAFAKGLRPRLAHSAIVVV